MYDKSTQEIGQTVAVLTKSADHDDAATVLSKIGPARQEVQRQYDQSKRAIDDEFSRLSNSGVCIDRRMIALQQKDGDEFSKFKDDAIKTLDEKEERARELLRRKSEKQPETWV